MRRRFMLVALAITLLPLACGGETAPDESSLRDSFAAQLAANEFLSNVQRSGGEISFSGPTAEGGTGSWRVVVDSATVEPLANPAQPYRGVVMSSWYVDGQLVTPSGRESNLPLELTSNGLAQECWALWNDETSQWEWE